MTPRDTKAFQVQETWENGKKCRKKNSSLYCSLCGENKSHTSGGCNVLKKRATDKDNPKHGTKDYKKKFKELNLLEAEAAHKMAKYFKYKNLNKAFAKKKTPKEETVNPYDFLDRNSSPRNESKNSSTKNGKTSIAYDSDSADND